jgi:hypothetical protein
VVTEFCKAWVSAGYPSTADMFDKLIEPESPTQFYAKFSEDVMTEATVPPTSHYKVYYRIYAGKDQGVYYNIYLKGQPQTEYYQQLGYMQVPGAVGYVPKGEQVDRTIDFTGPSSYTELCVKINAQEECGFGQVTTSFFMNELKDAYLTEQATTPITSESQCIEGTPSILPLASLNLQEGAEEALQPEIYKRGIIRICSTDNPGQTTEPARWKEVGYCGDKKIKCWLDSKSLNQSITDYGILNKTLSEAEKLAKQIMKTEGAWGEEQSADALSKANQNATKISEQLNKTLSRTNLQYAKADDVDNNVERIITPTLNQFNEIVRKSLLNAYKAQAQIATAEIYEKIARLIYENKIKTEQEKAKEGEKNKKTGATIEMDKQTEAIDYSLKKGEGVTIKFNNQDYEILLEEISLEQGTAAFLVNTERITVEIMNINKPNTKYINLDSSGDYLGITYTSAYYTKQTIGIKLEKKSGGGGIKKEDIVNMPSITADCASCSNGISLCSYDKCHKIGNCYIQTGGQLLGLKASCLNCRINLKCSDFNNQIECESNKCGVTGCIWDTDLDSCVEQGSSTPGTNEEGINIEAQSESSSQTSQDKSYEETLK